MASLWTIARRAGPMAVTLQNNRVDGTRRDETLEREQVGTIEGPRGSRGRVGRWVNACRRRGTMHGCPPLFAKTRAGEVQERHPKNNDWRIPTVKASETADGEKSRKTGGNQSITTASTIEERSHRRPETRRCGATGSPHHGGQWHGDRRCHECRDAKPNRVASRSIIPASFRRENPRVSAAPPTTTAPAAPIEFSLCRASSAAASCTVSGPISTVGR